MLDLWSFLGIKNLGRNFRQWIKLYVLKGIFLYKPDIIPVGFPHLNN